MRALLLLSLVGGVVGVGFLACNPNAIGRQCINPQGSAVNGTQITSPALECPSRLCLIQPPNASSGTSGGVDGGGPRPTCSALCASDDDCGAETLALCQNGFTCAVATDTGRFCCRKLCVCRDDLIPNFNQDPIDGGAVIPHACQDPSGSLTQVSCVSKM